MTGVTSSSVALSGVAMRYDAWGARVDALKDVTFELPEHGLILILGANASGKSTLLRIIAGSLRPTAGRVQVFGRDPAEASTRWRARTIASVGQHPERDLIPEMTVEEHARLFGHSWQSFETQLSLLEPEGHFSLLFSCRKQPVAVLSGGQRQSLGLALQLVRAAPVLLLDEPFAALDTERLTAFTGMIARISESRCVVNVTHAPEPLLEWAVKVVQLSDGTAHVQSPPAARRDGKGA